MVLFQRRISIFWKRILDNIYVAHGHMEKVKQSYENFYVQGGIHELKAAFFGHTISRCFVKRKGLYLLESGKPFASGRGAEKVPTRW
jgi:predicted phosphodiesterase